ncbi:cysteine desulfurase-like protein [Mycolicibacterium litorale]|uniref:cysteine desulfurase-like protein n=1 Tax=Mycolicibacterium litorale TaxID=758802 RepID=UPI003CF9A623
MKTFQSRLADPAAVSPSDTRHVQRLDVAGMRCEFPALRDSFVHLDGTAGTQVPRSVAAAIAETMSAAMSHGGTLTAAGRTAHAAVRAARSAIGDLVGAQPEGVIFGRNMTEMTFGMARTIAKTWRPGDEVVVCRLDHAANIAPWVLEADRAGATVRWIDFDTETGDITLDDVTAALSDRTRLVAMTAASNVLGTRPAIEQMAAAIHAAGALLYLDGVALTPHAPVDVTTCGADFFALSTHKVFGPHCAAVVARPALLEELSPDRLPCTPDSVPGRFELGTPSYEVLAGVRAMVDYLASLAGDTHQSRRARVLHAMGLIEEHEKVLRTRLVEGITSLRGVRVHGRPRLCTPTTLLSVVGTPPRALAEFLAERGIGVSVGTFHAEEATRALGLGPEGAIRVGPVAYNTTADIDAVVDAVGRFARAQ